MRWFQTAENSKVGGGTRKRLVCDIYIYFSFFHLNTSFRIHSPKMRGQGPNFKLWLKFAWWVVQCGVADLGKALCAARFVTKRRREGKGKRIWSQSMFTRQTTKYPILTSSLFPWKWSWFAPSSCADVGVLLVFLAELGNTGHACSCSK